MPEQEQSQGSQGTQSTLLPQLGTNILGSLLNNILAGIREDFARKDNYYYNEQAAQNADIRTRALYNDLQSPKALLEQYKEAGLSPSMMFSGGGVGAQPAGGAQSAGTAGISPNAYGMSAIDIAQLRLMNAEADKTEEEANTIRGGNERGAAEIDNLIKEANNKFLTGEQQALDVQLKNIELAIKGETGQTEIEITKQQLENLRNTGENLRATLKSLVIQNKISKESADAIITYNRERVAKQQAEIFLTNNQARLAQAGIALNAAQVAKLFNDIVIDKQAIKLKGDEVEISRKGLEARIKQWGKENDIENKKIDFLYNQMFSNKMDNDADRATRILEMLIPFAEPVKGARDPKIWTMTE